MIIDIIKFLSKNKNTIPSEFGVLNIIKDHVTVTKACRSIRQKVLMYCGMIKVMKN